MLWGWLAGKGVARVRRLTRESFLNEDLYRGRKGVGRELWTQNPANVCICSIKKQQGANYQGL